MTQVINGISRMEAKDDRFMAGHENNVPPCKFVYGQDIELRPSL